MKKMLEVEYCGECFHYHQKHCLKRGMETTFGGGIPSWCPLPAAGSGWRDISEAPKDGTIVLLWCDGVVEEGFFGVVSINGQYRWQNRNQWWPARKEPQHWQPLPPPPVGK